LTFHWLRKNMLFSACAIHFVAHSEAMGLSVNQLFPRGEHLFLTMTHIRNIFTTNNLY
jgi:hypothetical protein